MKYTESYAVSFYCSTHGCRLNIDNSDMNEVIAFRELWMQTHNSCGISVVTRGETPRDL